MAEQYLIEAQFACKHVLLGEVDNDSCRFLTVILDGFCRLSVCGVSMTTFKTPK